jgi:predicted small metal-binding protein
MKTLSCRDAGFDCDYLIQGETEEDIFRDGGQHALQVYADNERTNYLKEKGYRVLRFWNNEVLQNLESVLNMIFLNLEQTPTSPQPSPPKSGGEGI